MHLQTLFLGLGTQEILLIALIVVLFFGGKKIPEMMKGLGKGVRSFREGVEGKDDASARKEAEDNAATKDNPSDTGAKTN